jgi:predicted HTH transcriptional regulator
MNIADLLKNPESKTLEFKRDLSSPIKILHSIIAFANTAGGILVVGIEDKTKKVCGVEAPLLVEEQLANMISDNILPKIIPEIEILPWRNKYLLALHIYPSSLRPHYLKKYGVENGVYLRVGSTNRLADSTLIMEMKRFVLDGSFDEQALPDLSIKDIDIDFASKALAKADKLTLSNLETLKIITKHQSRKVPTVGGIVLFGHDREKYFPDAWIQCGRFSGTDKQHIIDSLEIHSYPVIAINQVMDFIRKHAMQAINIQDLRHQKKWNMPLAALREAIINAVVHADYAQRGAPIRVAIFDNRIEIENPGLLPFGLTIDDILAGVSKLRNRVIGRVFYKLGLIEQWGSGIKKILENCKNAGFDEPIFEETGIHFRVSIFIKSEKKFKLDKTGNLILEILKASKGLSTKEIAQLIHLSERATRTRLLALINKNLIIEISSSEKDPRKKYYIKS